MLDVYPVYCGSHEAVTLIHPMGSSKAAAHAEIIRMTVPLEIPRPLERRRCRWRCLGS